MKGLGNPVSALRHRNFRWFWAAQLGTTTGAWMDNLVRGWLVYEMTGSVGTLALVAASRSLPILAVGLIAGALADRFDRRRILQMALWTTSVAHLAMVLALSFGWLRLWHVFATTVVAGLGMAVQHPARQALLPATVTPSTLQNAVVLNAGTLTIGQAVGPAVGGLVIAQRGFTVAFSVLAGLCLTSLATTTRIRVPAMPGGPMAEPMLRSIWSGLRYVRNNQVILMLLLFAFVPLVLASPHQQLVPAVAAEVLEVGPRETGLLLGASGIGAFASLVILALFRSWKHPGRLLLGSVALFGAGVACFGLSRVFSLSVVALLVAGFFASGYRTITHALLIQKTDDLYLGRVNSIYLLDRGAVPLGTLMVGAVAEVIGSGMAVALSGGLTVASCCMVARGKVIRSI